MMVALRTSATPISFTQRADAGIPQERKVVAKPAAVTKVAHPNRSLPAAAARFPPR